MKKLVVLTGAGISAESGIKTFRDTGGLWENYDIMAVASPQGWQSNKELVLEFYNKRRDDIRKAEPNKAHYILAQLEKQFDVHIITQNIDNLHEKSGSSKVLHLHGEILKARSSLNPNYVINLENKNISLGDHCPLGGQLRPHIVWFGEEVPLMPDAENIVKSADIFVVIGTSLQVYPAAGLVYQIKNNVPIYVIDPNETNFSFDRKVILIQKPASEGTEELKELLEENS